MKRKLTTFVTIALSAIFLQNCSHICQKELSEAGKSPIRDEQNVMATLWMQTAAEYRALCYQAFNWARYRLEVELARQMDPNQKSAVVVDIDETVLDNTPFQVRLIETGDVYPAHWDDWMDHSGATPLPGATDFLNYAASRGVEVFYITNRKESGWAGTMQNLKKYDFPMVDSVHVIMRVDGSNSKETRRQKVMQTHKILLLMGDNLNDFSDVFEDKSIKERYAVTDKLRAEFGERFIVLPNPSYGDWEGAVYDYNWPVNVPERSQLRKSRLRNF